mmetsp:Transcript_30961/g.70875  ORF Transcript_30961/g.70875 Transcript_30961/m.70875 type:complete len:258 (+) Transcript_30961:69-842(+)
MSTQGGSIGSDGSGHGAPGAFPGRHPFSRIPNSAAFSMASGRKESHEESNARKLARVGPGSYTPSHQATEDTARRHKFPAEPRPMQSTQLEETPAPALLHSDNPKYRKSPQYSFGSTDRRCDLDHMPYADGVQISESDRRPRPGPGQHSPRDGSTTKFAKTPAYSLAGRKAMPSVVPRPWDSPGPAAYSADRSTLEGPRVKFGAASRMPPSSNKSKQPGPGQYSELAVTRTGHAIGASSPRWTMAGRGEIVLTDMYY